MTDSQQRIERITARLLENIEQRLSTEGGIELKDYKSVTGALKELKELSREDGPEPEQGLTVRFVGEAEEYSR